MLIELRVQGPNKCQFLRFKGPYIGSSLKLLKGDSIGDYIGEYYREDYSSYYPKP